MSLQEPNPFYKITQTGDLKFRFTKIGQSVGNLYTCDKCRETVKTRWGFGRHLRIHDWTGPVWKCKHPGCNYAADQPSNLFRHMETNLPGSKRRRLRKKRNQLLIKDINRKLNYL